MENKKADLSKSYEALTAAGNALAALESVLEAKAGQIRKRTEDDARAFRQKEEELDQLKISSAQALRHMEEIISKINNVLEQNGSGNSHN